MKLIDKWARAFCSVGVNADEMVPVYGTWCPDIAAIFFALNAIGAHPYFEKLDITELALECETQGAKVAVVFDALWNAVSKRVFGQDRFRHVFMIRATDSMSFPLKQLVKMKTGSVWEKELDSSKYHFKKDVDIFAERYTGNYEAAFKKDRIALITSSSGTTSQVVKGIMDSNESALSNVLSSSYSEPGFFPGKECLITLPPTASTAINCFFLLPLFRGMTIRLDPRADEENWPKLILKYKPSLTLSTGSMWYSFYRHIDKLIKQGKRVDLSFSDCFVMGGSGVTPEQLEYMNDLNRRCNAPHPIVSGYGCSEFFGVITVEKYEVAHASDKPVISVGIPIPSATISIFDDNGKELKCGERGEIYVKGNSVMHGYFGKPEVTQSCFCGEWLKTGDIGEIDEDGYLYCYGRKKSSIEVNKETVFLFDIANDLRHKLNLEDCMVEVKELNDGTQSIVVYYVQKSGSSVDEEEIVKEMNSVLSAKNILVDGYREFKEAFPISPTTLKPKNRYPDGFVNYSLDGQKTQILYKNTDKDDVWEMSKTNC